VLIEADRNGELDLLNRQDAVDDPGAMRLCKRQIFFHTIAAPRGDVGRADLIKASEP
jgi:hypothetical protein